jgi:hypothetical protein
MGYKYNPINNTFFFDQNIISHLPQIVWHITSKCLLNCKFCFDEKLSVDYEKGIQIFDVSILKKLGVQKIDISGGEPLLFEFLPEIVDKCKKLNISMTLTTSGYGSKANIDWLLKNWALFSRIIVSLDGLESTHNYLRGNNLAFDAFNEIYNALLIKGCDILRINSVITSHLILESDREGFLQLWGLNDIHPWIRRSAIRAFKAMDYHKDFIYNSIVTTDYKNLYYPGLLDVLLECPSEYKNKLNYFLKINSVLEKCDYESVISCI